MDNLEIGLITGAATFLTTVIGALAKYTRDQGQKHELEKNAELAKKDVEIQRQDQVLEQERSRRVADAATHMAEIAKLHRYYQEQLASVSKKCNEEIAQVNELRLRELRERYDANLVQAGKLIDKLTEVARVMKEDDDSAPPPRGRGERR